MLFLYNNPTCFAAVSFMAKDWLTGNWYFVDPYLQSIIVCNSVGKRCRRIIKFQNRSKPQTIALDPNEGYVHSCQLTPHSGVTSANNAITCELPSPAAGHRFSHPNDPQSLTSIQIISWLVYLYLIYQDNCLN